MGGPARGSAPAAQGAAPLTYLALRDVQMVSGRGAPRHLDARSPRGVEQGAGIRSLHNQQALNGSPLELPSHSGRRGYLNAALGRDRRRTCREFARRRAGRRRGICQGLKQPVECLAVLFDGCTFTVSQRNPRQSPINIRPRLQHLRPAARLRKIKIATCASHAVWALFKECIATVTVTEVVVLPRLACGRRTA